jgi:hypothetical protein
VRLQILTAACMKMRVFWDIYPCCSHVVSIFVLMKEAVNTSETSVNFYQTIWRSIRKECHLHADVGFLVVTPFRLV